MFLLVVRRHSPPVPSPEPARRPEQPGRDAALHGRQEDGPDGRQEDHGPSDPRAGREAPGLAWCPGRPAAVTWPCHGTALPSPRGFDTQPRMRPFPASPACLIAAAMLAASQMPAAAAAAPARWLAAARLAEPPAPVAAAPSVAAARRPPAAPASDTLRASMTMRTAESATALAGSPSLATDAGAIGTTSPEPDRPDTAAAGVAPATGQPPTAAQAPSGEADPTGPGSATPAPGTAPEVSDPDARRSPAPSRHGTRDAPHIGHYRVFEHPPCPSEQCPATVSDLDSRQSFEATVSLGPMHLARQLEEFARSGQIELLLSGELRRGTAGPTLQALHLEGVTPHAQNTPHASRPGHARAGRHVPVLPGHRLLRT